MAYSASFFNSALGQFIRSYRFQHDGVMPDIREFLKASKSMLFALLELNLKEMKALKFWLCASVDYVRREDETKHVTPRFANHMCTVLHESEILDCLSVSFEKILQNVEKFEENGSDWVVFDMLHLDLHIAKYQPLKGSTYVPLPESIARKNAVVNVQNRNDNECFKWCVLASLHPADVHPERISHYRNYAHELNFDSIAFPLQVESVSKFCQQNPGISVNVFSAEGEIRPLRIATHKRDHHVNLLYYRGHYCLIRHFDRLLGDQNRHRGRKYFCDMCLFPFYSAEQLASHARHCVNPDCSKIEMPDNETLKFTNRSKMVRRPVTVYADFECLLEPIQTCSPDPKKSLTQKYQRHVLCAFGAQCTITCCDNNVKYEPYKNFTGKGCVERFLSYVIDIAEGAKSKVNRYREVNMTPQDEQNFQMATRCWICEEDLPVYDRVRDHCHTCGRYRGAARAACNSQLQSNSDVAVLFHNLRRYDGHILIKAINDLCASKRDMKINCIAKSTEDYISFSLTRKKSKRRRSGPAQTAFKINFLDSCQFLLSSLDELVKNLPSDEFHALESYFPAQEVRLLKRKGVFPYDYLDSWQRLDRTDPPPRDAFFNRLTNTHISDDDYRHVLDVWHAFKMRSLKDYMELYLKTDVLLLCDVFENFRRFALSNFGLDPCHYYTLPSFAWDSCLKLTKVELDLLSDPDMYKFFESGIRGGISIICQRYAKANNPYLDGYNPMDPSSYIIYLDANNLYGCAMVQKLPVKNFKWLTEDEILNLDIANLDADADKGMVLEVDLEYPRELHDSHNCYPVAPERLKVTYDMLSPHCKNLLGESKFAPMEKLIPNLMDKTEYVIDIRNLRYYMSLGLRLKKIHRAISFDQANWMQPYIDFNTRMRQQATSKLMKNFFKLMNNSVYGKTMENVRKYIEIELVTSRRRFFKVTKKPEFLGATIFTPNLVACHIRRRKIVLNKPIYCGFVVLELSKKHMYQFHYDKIRPTYGDRAKLLMSDTDSLVYHITTADLYRDMQECLDDYDTSEYPPDHLLHSVVNKSVLGKMKDETKGVPISEFVGLRAKMYSFRYGEDECKRAKGVKRSVVRNDLQHDDYKRVLQHNTVRYNDMCSIRSFLHEIYSIRLHKKSLASFDDKRYILEDGHISFAYGHFAVNTAPVAPLLAAAAPPPPPPPPTP